jgi:hypothetical protein
MTNLDSQLRRHFAKQRPSVDFDTRVLARIDGTARLTRDPARSRAQALAVYQQTRARIVSERRHGMLWVAAFGVLAMLVAAALAPVTGDFTQVFATLLGKPVLPGLSVGNLLLLLPIAIWLAVRQPSMASR